MSSEAKDKAAAEKQKRLEAALRANLKRRKEQRRGRDVEDDNRGGDS